MAISSSSGAGTAALKPKPTLTTAQIFNMSFGFLGIQFGFALQNSNASGILRNYGAEVEHLSWFWLAAPLIGLIVQPIVGHYSDRTWNRLGRRRPYFLAGAILSSSALALMPNANILGSIAPLVIIGAAFLMIMDACFNLAMEPFRALVADNLPDSQRTKGFAIQTFLIGIGAVMGSALPAILNSVFHVSNEAPEGVVAQNVKLAFYIGASIFVLSVLWTVFKTKEYPPKEYAEYHGVQDDKKEGLSSIFKDFARMPKTMKQLGLVQFFSWFALFGMWVFTTDTIATHIFGLSIDDKSSKAYREAQDWTGVIFAVYNGVSAAYALLLPTIAKKIGRKQTHALSLFIGGIGLISVYFAPNKEFLIGSMVCVGIAWASILAMPYVILSGSIPAGKMGIYMGIFNFFITIPQILNGLIGGPIVKHLYNNQPVYALVLAGVFMLCAAISVIYVYDPGAIRIKEEKKLA
ncbi:MFS transporter [Pseudoflavitalea sp. G-6-1-2]|uniref:MFS transporter n=1 Tax=Pseudoflavitalea sp. G-6-1-2 TaxID=2728841 RepID=UPI00197CD384|nr:MFS transporter [Pseudoflavitalea sp. G-6-1-2]